MGKVKKQYSDEEKRAFLVNLDMKVMKALAGNDEKQRRKFLRNLREWMDQRSQKMPLTDEDIKRIWKSLYYTMWMSDKPLVQEQCAEGISKLVHFSTWKESLRFFKFGLVVLSIEWFGIDQLRLDKFSMFVRRLLRQALILIQKYKWQMDIIQEFNGILLDTVLIKDNSKHLGLTLHTSEIFLEELAKVSLGRIKPKVVHEFLKPFIKYISISTDNRQIKHTCKTIFLHLLNQTDEGIDYEKKFEAWKQQGFPGGNIDYMTKIEKDVSNDEEEEGELEELEVLDPRAGSVNVDLPQLKFNALEVVNLLKEVKFTSGTNTKTRKTISRLIIQFEKLSKGKFPLGIKEIPGIEDDGYNMKLKQSVNRLVKFEKQVLRDSNKNRKRKRGDQKKQGNELVDESNETLDESNETDDCFEDKLQEFIKHNDPIVMNGLKKDKSRIVKKKLVKTVKKKVRPLAPTSLWTVEEFIDDSIVNSSQEGTTSLNVTAIVASPENIATSSPIIDSSLIRSTKKSPVSKQMSPKTENVVLNGFSKEEVVDEWKTSAQPGEYEYFIPSPIYKEKTKKMVQKFGQSPSAFLNNSIQKLTKSRHSLDSNLIKNPFSKKASSPEKKRRLSMSVKKVKINLGLNQSQEMYEHDQQVRKSPAIPFDANKKPSKPLLKPYTFTGPMNPFYKFKSKLL